MLNPHHRHSLDQAGWLLLPRLIPAKELPDWQAAFEAADNKGQHLDRNRRGTRHPDLHPQEALWQPLLHHPRVQAALTHLLTEDYVLRDFKGRDPQSGFGEQGLHSDALPRSAGEPTYVGTVLWLLDPFLPDNGATRLVPGSHHYYSPLPKNFSQPHSRHPEEITVTGPAGSALIFNGHLWHSGTRNRSQVSRRVLQAVYYRQNNG
jgi:ectoine hydroxylase-related dioxygenase (phytanoyl-CoA dioxygenase family)